MANRTKMTDRAREEFLAVLRETCNVSEAARRVGISRTCAYEHRANDGAFAAAWEEAEQEAVDKLEYAAWNRATVEQSDRILELLLKAHRPEKYKDRAAVEHTGKDGGPIETRTKVEASDDVLAALKAVTGDAAG